MSKPALPPVILLTGGSGQVGNELLGTLRSFANVVAPSSEELDLADPDSIRTAMRRIRPAVVVNAGAYTAVDRAEDERDRCLAINAIAPGILAEEAARSGAGIVHYSTDYVFNGRSARPYLEDDATGPLNVYGQSKLAGEDAVRAAGDAHLILRTSWVYGARGHNFLRTVLRLARERDELRIVGDQVGSPTWSRLVADVTAELLRPMLASGAVQEAMADSGGVYHVTASGRASWYEFAQAILARDAARGSKRSTRVVPIGTAEYPTPAARPAMSVLDTGKVQRRFGVALPPWEEQLDLVMAELPH